MQMTCRIVNYCIYRHFSVSNRLDKESIYRSSKVLKKLLQKDTTKGYYDDPYALPLMRPGNASKIRPHQKQKRIATLNKVLTSYITDLIFTGDIAPDLLEREIEIHGVEVASNANVIRIYWSHNDMNIEHIAKELEDIVVKAGLELRNKLSQLNVVGMVPPVVFVKYKYTFLEKEIERRLEIADYGPDYKAQTYKNSATKIITFNPVCQEDRTDDEKCASNEFSVTLPVMRHHVMGVNHSKLMSKIKLAIEKSHKTANTNEIFAEMRNNIGAAQSAEYSKILEKQQKQQEDFIKYMEKVKTEQKIKRKPSRRLKNFEQCMHTEQYSEFEDAYYDDEILEEDDAYFDDDYEEK